MPSNIGIDIDDIEEFEDNEEDLDEELEASLEEDDEEFETEEIEDETEDEDIDPSEYEDGTEVDMEELSSDEEYEDEEEIASNEFISATGDIVVMEDTDEEDAFDIKYCDIKNITLHKRIRKVHNVDGLVRSIKSTGLISPITVAPLMADGYYVLLDGFRRLIACAKAGKKRIPVVVNNKVSTSEIPILEAMYNHSMPYSISEQVEYIDYLEKEKGIMSASLIEYLLQMNSGDYTKLKDILNDNDPEIVDKLYDGIFTIEQAFKKLEQRRKRESNEEKENRKAAQVYGDEEKSGVDQIAGSGEEADEKYALSEDEIKSITINANDLDDNLEEESLDNMLKEGDAIEGFKPHKQTVGEREFIDPIIRKSVLARDNFTCACCKRGGESFVDALDYHHILPVFLGGSDTVDNGIALCLTCHRLVHLYSTGDLHLNKEKTTEEIEKMTDEEVAIYHDEQMRFKRIVRLGTVIREGIARKGMNREEYKKQHPNTGIGRNRPGHIQEKA